MIRSFGVAAVLSCVTTLVMAQTQSAPGTATTRVKPAATRPAPKAKTAAKPLASANTGPCQIGIIPAIGNTLVVQNVGLTVFGNEYAEVPTDWGFDELAAARVRASAGPGVSVRRIAYATGAFDRFYHPSSRFSRDPSEGITSIVQHIAANSGCAKYVVITRFEAKLEGTNQTLNGVGFLTRMNIFDRSAVFANVGVTVFDGKTFAIRKDPFATFGAILSASFAKLGGNENLRTLDNFQIPKSPEEASQNVRIRDAIKVLITEQLDKRLPEYLKEQPDQR